MLNKVAQYLFWGGIIMTTGCGDGNLETSKISFRIPESLQKVSGSSTNLKICIAVDVTGVGIKNSKAKTCDPEYGKFYGLFQANEDIEIQVPRGKRRVIRLYSVETTGHCGIRKRHQGLSPFGMGLVHQLSKSKEIDLLGNSEQVTLVMDEKSEANTMLSLYNLPESCGTSSHLNKRAGKQTSLRNLTHSSTVKSESGENHGSIHLRMGSSSLNLKNSSQTTAIRPAGLGETL